MKKLKGIFICTALAALILLSSNFVMAAFNDVQSSHTNYDAIEYIENEGIVDGYPDGTYQPDRNINRAEFTKIIINSVFPGEATGANCFPDVAGDWYAQYVCFAKSKGIIKGYPDGTFKPAQNINFVEAAKIIVNGYGYEAGSDNVWYKPFVTVLGGKNAIPMTISAFDKLVNRGEMAEMMHRLKAEIMSKDSKTYNDLAGEEEEEEEVEEDESTVKVKATVVNDTPPAEEEEEEELDDNATKVKINATVE